MFKTVNAMNNIEFDKLNLEDEDEILWEEFEYAEDVVREDTTSPEAKKLALERAKRFDALGAKQRAKYQEEMRLCLEPSEDTPKWS